MVDTDSVNPVLSSLCCTLLHNYLMVWILQVDGSLNVGTPTQELAGKREVEDYFCSLAGAWKHFSLSATAEASPSSESAFWWEFGA